MSTDDEIRLADISKRITMIAMLFLAPANILVGLGIYGVFAAKGNAFHPLLNDMQACYALIAVGIVIEGIGLVRFMSLVQERARMLPKRPPPG